MAEGASGAVKEAAQQSAFALADKPIGKASFRQILTKQHQRAGVDDVIVLTALMNSLEVGLFYLYYSETGVWGAIATIVA